MTLVRPTDENLRSVQATRALAAWLIHASRLRRWITYREAKERLENDCGFSNLHWSHTGKVAGSTMDTILEHEPHAPLLNILLVQSATQLPGSGAASYLARRYRDRAHRWLKRVNPHENSRWRSLIEVEAARVYGYPHWDKVYQAVYRRCLPATSDDTADKGKDGIGHGKEGENHKKLRLRVWNEPSLVRRGLQHKNTDTEVNLLSGDRVDVVSRAKDRIVAIEVKSRDSNWNDLRRGVFQCIKYRAVITAQDIRQEPKVESWLVTETKLDSELENLARQLGVKTRVVK